MKMATSGLPGVYASFITGSNSIPLRVYLAEDVP